MSRTYRYDYTDRRDDRITGRLSVQAPDDRAALTRAKELAERLDVILVRFVDPDDE